METPTPGAPGRRFCSALPPQHSSPLLFTLACWLVLLRHQHLILSCLVVLHQGERPSLRLAEYTLQFPHLLQRAGAFQRWMSVSAPPAARRFPSVDHATLNVPPA